MSPITLEDTVYLQTGGSDIVVTCRHPQVPEDESNLAYLAAKVFYQRFGQPASIDITIDKQIPVGAGLGGGSSNAAAVLLGLNHCHANPFSLAELADMGMTIGADVPFFIYGVPALVGGVGERIEPRPLESIKKYRFVVIFPGFGISTAMVYKNLDFGLTNCEKKLKSIPLRNQTFDAAQYLCNDLETVVVTRYPEIKQIKRELNRLGAQGALMSGSGSSVFGLFTHSHAAWQAARSLRVNRRWRVFTAALTSAQDTIMSRFVE